MTEKQVLFRIDGKLLESLDRRIAKDGFTTRNAWFKQVVQDYGGRKGAAKAPRANGRRSSSRSK